MIIMTGLINAIKDNGFLALSSTAASALIYVLHILHVPKVPLLRYDSQSSR